MPEDAYPTPGWCVDRLLDGLTEVGCPLPVGTWHEVMAGDGSIIKAVKRRLPDVAWVATELREVPELRALEAEGVEVHMPTDYLGAPGIRSDVIVTNPSFEVAEQTIKKALTEADWVAMLLRLNFLGTADRAAWLRKEMADIYSIPDRPNFVASYKCKPRDAHDKGCGWHMMLPISVLGPLVCPECGRKVARSASDSTEYGWFVWTPERGRRRGHVIVLENTPKEIRCADRPKRERKRKAA